MSTFDDPLMLLFASSLVVAFVLWRAVVRTNRRRREKDEQHRDRRKLWTDRR